MTNDIYGRTVDMTSDGTTDTYTVGGSLDFQFPTGTDSSVAYLAFAKQGKIAQFQFALQDFILTRYPLETRWSFIALYVDAQQNVLLINRKAYINTLFTWARSVITYGAGFAATVNAATDPATIFAMNWNLSTLAASDPAVSPLVAAGINN